MTLHIGIQTFTCEHELAARIAMWNLVLVMIHKTLGHTKILGSRPDAQKTLGMQHLFNFLALLLKQQ